MIQEKFTSPQAIWSQVEEELKSYFNSGSVDNSLFSKWTFQAMSKFKNSSKPLKEIYLPLNNYTAELPCDFDSVKALWACGVSHRKVVPNPSSFYYQKDCRVTQITDKCNECFNDCDCCTCPSPCEPCDPNQKYNLAKYRVTHKITGVTILEYYFSHLLTPATYNTISKCGRACDNIGTNSEDQFDIRDNKIMTNYREGNLHLFYYSQAEDENGEILIPDQEQVKDYIMKFIKVKIFEQLFNQTTDESFNQIQLKLGMYENQKNEAFIIAETELKRWTVYQIANQAIKQQNRLNKYRRTLR